MNEENIRRHAKTLTDGQIKELPTAVKRLVRTLDRVDNGISTRVTDALDVVLLIDDSKEGSDRYVTLRDLLEEVITELGGR